MHPLRSTGIVAVLLAAAAMARGNHAPVNADATVAGQIRPTADSPVVVLSEKLTIALDGQSPVAQLHHGSSPMRAHVTAEYRLHNPTDKQVELPLAFPVFGRQGALGAAPAAATRAPSGRGAANPWYAVTQDGSPLAVDIQFPAMKYLQEDEARQKEWHKRLDEWVAQRPDVAALVKDLQMAPLNEASNEVSRKLRIVLEPRFGNSDAFYSAWRILIANDPAEVFGDVCHMMPYVDEGFRILDGKDNPVSILQGNVTRFEPHRAEWTGKVVTWLSNIPGAEDAGAQARALAAKLKARNERLDQAKKLLQSKYGLSPLGSAHLTNVFAQRPHGEAPAGNLDSPLALSNALSYGLGPVTPGYVQGDLARELWPETAAPIDAGLKAQADEVRAWGGDRRFVSPLTGKLYYRGREREAQPLAALLAVDDSPRPQQVAGEADWFDNPLPMLLRYTATIPAHGDTTLAVTYDTGVNVDQGLSDSGAYAICQFAYVLETVKYWKSFGPIEVTVSAPREWQLVIRPELPQSRQTGDRTEHAGTLMRVDGNLHVAAVADGGTALGGAMPADQATLERLRGTLKNTAHRQARIVLHAAIASVLARMGSRYDAWAEILAGRAEAPGVAMVADDLHLGAPPPLPLEVWQYVELKARSPLLATGHPNESDPQKNELRRFGERNEWSPQDLQALARRVSQWDTSRGTVPEVLCQKFLLCYGDVEREKNLADLVEMALTHDEHAELALRLVAVLPGAKAAAWPLVVKHLPQQFPGNFSPFDLTVRDALMRMRGSPAEVLALAQKSDDQWILLSCMNAMRNESELDPAFYDGLLAVEDRIAKFDGEYTQYLELLAREETRGIPALRALMKRRPAWAMRIGAILAEHGDFSALEGAVEMYNKGAAPEDQWAVERREMSKAIDIIARRAEPGIFRRLTYRRDLPVWDSERLLMGMPRRPDVGAWPLVEGFYDQHVKGKEQLTAGWFANLLGSLGDQRALPMLLEMAPHGNMVHSCALAIGDLLYPAN